MIIFGKDGNKYLVRTNSADSRCYLIDIELEYILGYDIEDKFMRFGNFIAINNKDVPKKEFAIINRIIKDSIK